YITLDNKSILGKKIKVMGDDGKEREVAVSGNIEAGKGAGEIKILEGSLIEKEIRSGIEREIVEKGDTQDNHNFAGNVKVTIKDSVVNQSLDLNGLGDREITLDNSTVHGTIYAGHYSDSKITVKDSKVGFKIIGEGGKDTIIVDNSTIGANPKFKDESSSVVLGDGGGFNDGDDTIEIKNNSIIQGGVEGGGGKDTITVSGKSTVVKDKVSGGDGDDTITVEEGANVYYEKITPVYKDVYTGPKPDNLLPEPDLPDIYSDEEYEEFSKKRYEIWEHNNKVWEEFSKTDTYKNNLVKKFLYNELKTTGSIEGNDGNDTINITSEAKTQIIDSGKGDDAINITGKSTVKNKVSGGEGDDKINVTSEAEVREVNSGENDDKVNINSGAKINTIYLGEGEDGIKVEGEGTKVEQGINGFGKNTVEISDGADVYGVFLQGKGNDTVTVIGTNGTNTGTQTIVREHIITGNGNDEIKIEGGALVGRIDSGGPLSNAGEDDDKVTITGEGTQVIYSNARVETGGGNDTVEVSKGASVKHGVYLGKDDDTIIVDSATVGTITLPKTTYSIAGDAGKDTIVITNESTVQGISGDTDYGYYGIPKGGDSDVIVIENGSKVELVNGGEGDNDVLVAETNNSQIDNKMKFETEINFTEKDGNVNIDSISGKDTIDLSHLKHINNNDIKSIKLPETDNAKLNITAQDVLDIDKANGSETLTIIGGSGGDHVNKTDDSKWDPNGNQYSTSVTDESETKTVIIKIEDIPTDNINL
ncbi:hypothetical protein, partial [Campylobacter sp. RM16191]|uniref:hypothetical protein n=1 Tax=Campylobacter sp. RM16191 TaxID=1705728 RepID=UPI001473D0CD